MRALVTGANGFVGIYDGSNWSLTTNGGGGSLVDSSPVSLKIIGSDSALNFQAIVTTLEIDAQCTGQYSFDWDYSSDNTGPGFDPAGYIVDGVFHTFDEQPYDEFDEDDDMYGDDTW